METSTLIIIIVVSVVVVAGIVLGLYYGGVFDSGSGGGGGGGGDLPVPDTEDYDCEKFNLSQSVSSGSIQQTNGTTGLTSTPDGLSIVVTTGIVGSSSGAVLKEYASNPGTVVATSANINDLNNWVVSNTGAVASDEFLYFLVSAANTPGFLYLAKLPRNENNGFFLLENTDAEVQF